MDAAGIGGDVAADLAGAFGGEAQGEETVLGCGGILNGFERCAGLRCERVAGCIDGADRLHAVEAEHDLSARLERGLAADQSGIAALRDDGDALLMRELQDRADLARRSRPEHHWRAPEIAVAPLLAVGLNIGRVCQRALDANNGCKAR